nr:hypothetical protein CFP56_31531 [Quercus suber]
MYTVPMLYRRHVTTYIRDTGQHFDRGHKATAEAHYVYSYRHPEGATLLPTSFACRSARATLSRVRSCRIMYGSLTEVMVLRLPMNASGQPDGPCNAMAYGKLQHSSDSHQSSQIESRAEPLQCLLISSRSPASLGLTNRRIIPVY